MNYELLNALEQDIRIQRSLQQEGVTARVKHEELARSLEGTTDDHYFEIVVQYEQRHFISEQFPLSLFHARCVIFQSENYVIARVYPRDDIESAKNYINDHWLWSNSCGSPSFITDYTYVHPKEATPR